MVVPETRAHSRISDGFAVATPAMAAERAASELRYGRPVIVRDAERALAVLALDAVSPEIYDRFASTVSHRHALCIAAPRARRLGFAGDGAMSVPLRDRDFAAASRIAYAPDAGLPDDASDACGLMAVSADLARLSLLLPAMVCAEVTDDAAAFAVCSCIDASVLQKPIAARQSFTIIARTPVPLKDHGACDFVVFRGGLAQKDQVAIVVGHPDPARPVPVRIHSSCLTGDLCGSLKCDCGDQLRNALSMLKKAGGGVLVYLDQEGRGTGIGAKMRAYGYQNQGLDTIEADAALGYAQDERHYEAAVAMLRLLGISSVALLTNNPRKMAALAKAGIGVADRIGIAGRVTAENQNYLRTKTLRSGHMFDLETLVPGL